MNSADNGRSQGTSDHPTDAEGEINRPPTPQHLPRPYRTSLQEVLQPRSVAILGASRAPRKWGHVAAKQLIASGFPGDIYLINPSVPEILGYHTYPKLSDVPTPVDLAVIATSFNAVSQAIDDCIAHGVKGIVIITAR